MSDAVILDEAAEFPVMTPALAKGMATPKGTQHEPEHRRSLSGKLVDREPAKAWWLVTEERAEASKVTGPRLPKEPLPAPVFICECREPVDNGIDCIITQGEHLSTEFRGHNRRQRRDLGERGGYARNLRLRLGAARTERSERAHPQRVADRNRIREEKVEQARRVALTLAMLRGDAATA